MGCIFFFIFSSHFNHISLLPSFRSDQIFCISDWILSFASEVNTFELFFENQFVEFVFFSEDLDLQFFFFYQILFERKTDATEPRKPSNRHRKNRSFSWTEMGCHSITVGLSGLRDWDRNPTLSVRCPALATTHNR